MEIEVTALFDIYMEDGKSRRLGSELKMSYSLKQKEKKKKKKPALDVLFKLGDSLGPIIRTKKFGNISRAT